MQERVEKLESRSHGSGKDGRREQVTNGERNFLGLKRGWAEFAAALSHWVGCPAQHSSTHGFVQGKEL